MLATELEELPGLFALELELKLGLEVELEVELDVELEVALEIDTWLLDELIITITELALEFLIELDVLLLIDDALLRLLAVDEREELDATPEKLSRIKVATAWLHSRSHLAGVPSGMVVSIRATSAE